MSDKQQSAVDSIIEYIDKMQYSYSKMPKKHKKEVDAILTATTLIKIKCNQAKELFKQQIIDAFYDGKSNGMDISHPLSSAKEIPSDQYFNDKFKTESNGTT